MRADQQTSIPDDTAHFGSRRRSVLCQVVPIRTAASLFAASRSSESTRGLFACRPSSTWRLETGDWSLGGGRPARAGALCQSSSLVSERATCYARRRKVEARFDPIADILKRHRPPPVPVAAATSVPNERVPRSYCCGGTRLGGAQKPVGFLRGPMRPGTAQLGCLGRSKGVLARRPLRPGLTGGRALKVMAMDSTLVRGCAEAHAVVFRYNVAPSWEPS